ncbi:hypothetical protein BDZ89DRAFT_691902 [Hymenopellis radicata]|nr:hypothetical protein BDZ89DRAFT_691902 [Hymenopellis radicata]
MEPDRTLCNLPVDIARQVIETAVVMDRKSALAFVLVSKTLREWIDPLLYHTVVLDSYRKGQLFVSAMFRRNDPGFFERNVKTLSINHDVYRAHIEYLLPICRGVISLAFWNRNRILKPYASILSPLRLSVTNLTKSQVVILPSSITHLNIFFTEDLSLADFPPTWSEVFKQCPNLTHISFDYAPTTTSAVLSSAGVSTSSLSPSSMRHRQHCERSSSRSSGSREISAGCSISSKTFTSRTLDLFSCAHEPFIGM